MEPRRAVLLLLALDGEVDAHAGMQHVKVGHGVGRRLEGHVRAVPQQRRVQVRVLVGPPEVLVHVVPRLPPAQARHGRVFFLARLGGNRRRRQLKGKVQHGLIKRERAPDAVVLGERAVDERRRFQPHARRREEHGPFPLAVSRRRVERVRRLVDSELEPFHEMVAESRRRLLAKVDAEDEGKGHVDGLGNFREVSDLLHHDGDVRRELELARLLVEAGLVGDGAAGRFEMEALAEVDGASDVSL
mmetsp:Transcript_450/g.1592  ORF Transcript_450/g.1592 Transcript_450/m.1592 type:complete len:245 (-) Transcript_450:645-1379(-)